MWTGLKPLSFGKELTLSPKDKILDLTKLRAFADDKSNIAKMMMSLFDRIENTVEKGENAGCIAHTPFSYCFPKPSTLESLKVGLCGKELNQCIKPYFTGL